MGGFLEGGLGIGSAAAADAGSSAAIPALGPGGGEGWLGLGQESLTQPVQPVGVDAVMNPTASAGPGSIFAEPIDSAPPLNDPNSPIPEGLQEFVDDLRRSVPAPKAAEMAGMANLEYNTLSPDQDWLTARGGTANAMQGPLQFNTEHHGVMPTKDEYIAKALQFFGEGRDPTGGMPFDSSSFWDNLDRYNNPAGGSFIESYKKGGFSAADFHPLNRGYNSASRMTPEQGSYYRDIGRPYVMGDPENMVTEQLIDLLSGQDNGWKGM